MQEVNRHVLVVEDDPDQSEIYAALLYYNGFEVTEARTVAEALTAVAQARPDAILMDVMLPDGNGLTTAHQLKATPASANIPIVCMTAHDIHDQRAADAGCSCLLRKPFNGADLVHAFTKAFRESATLPQQG